MMMGSGMPNSHNKIPLPMLIHSRPYRDSTDAQRFDGGGGSGILAGSWIAIRLMRPFAH
jgi:hypothetical protein